MFNSEAFEKFIYIFLIALIIFVIGVQVGIAHGRSMVINESGCIYAENY